MVGLSLVQKRLKNGTRPDLKTLGILTCGSEPLQCMAAVFRIIKYQLPIQTRKCHALQWPTNTSCKVVWKLVESQPCNFQFVFYWISLIFFAKCDLFRLQNTPTTFCEVVPSCCKVVQKQAKMSTLLFMVHFLSDFFTCFC